MPSQTLYSTNPRLTGNFKLVIDSLGNWNFDTIESSPELQRTIYKNYEYNKSLNYGTNLKNYFNLFTDKSVIYDVVSEQDLGPSQELSTQNARLYNFGAYSDTSKYYEEKFRFFAPLDIDSGDIPDAFVILKTSDVSNTQELFTNSTLVKCIELGELKNKVFNNIEKSYLDVQFPENISTNGININTGLVSYQSEDILTSMISNETTIMEFENYITNSFKRNNSLYSSIINLEFMFDDNEVDNSISTYVGFYVKFNNVSKDVIDGYIGQNVMKLLRRELDIIQYIDGVDELKTYQVTKGSQKANAFGVSKTPICKINLSLQPRVGKYFRIFYDDVLEYELKISNSIIGNNVLETLKNISNDINSNYSGVLSSVLATIDSEGSLVLKSAVNGIVYENLKVVTTSAFSIQTPLYTNSEYENNFIGSGTNTISINTYFNPEAFNQVRFYDDDKVMQIYDIIRVYEYEGDYLYKLNKPILNKTNTPDYVWFSQKTEEQPILCSVLDMCNLRTDTISSKYANTLDFSIEDYKEILFNSIQEAPSSNDQDKINIINKYFNNIDVTNEFLYKSIDLLTQEATTISNEYDRLGENNLEVLSTINKLYRYISQWSILNGEDTYNRDYKLNISLPFRHESFGQSRDANSIDIRYHTHSWMIIGEGIMPYININDENYNKFSSYTRVPVTKQLLQSTEVDAYDFLEYETETQVYELYSIIEKKNSNGVGCMFRGVKLHFDDVSLLDYKFSSILLTTENVENDNYSLEYIRNDKHKTLTLLCKFYIPINVLNSVNSNIDFYTLDRSLLYFSNDNYSIDSSSIDFGFDQISLRLYDNISAKTYLGKVLTNRWWHEFSGSVNLIEWQQDLDTFMGGSTSKYMNTFVGYYVNNGSNNTLSVLKNSTDNPVEVLSGTSQESISMIVTGSGGYKTSSISIDNTKTYRFSCWVKLDSINSTTKFGVSSVVNTLEGIDVNTPYFLNGSINALNTWVLIVGHVRPHNYNSTDLHPDSGVFYTNGNRVVGAVYNDFKWKSITKYAVFENSFIGSQTSNTQLSWNPQLQILNGGEQNISILKNGDLPQVGNKSTLLHVSRGNSTIFKTSFLDLMSSGEDQKLTISTNEYFDIDTPTNDYGVKLIFSDIREVDKDHFWCSKIELKYVSASDNNNTPEDYLDDTGLTLHTLDIFEEYKNNNNIFEENNEIYMSKSLAYENSIYAKILTNKANISRFKEISTANILNTINSLPIKINDNGLLKTNIIFPEELNTNITLNYDSENNTINKLTNPYTFPMIRFNGKYDLIKDNILCYTRSSELERINIKSENNININIANTITLNNTEDVEHSYYVQENLFNDNDFSFYNILNNATNRTFVPYKANIEERKSLISRVLNSPKTLIINSVASENITYYDLLENTANQYVGEIDDLTNYQKMVILSLYYTNVTLTTVDNYNIKEILISNFIENTLNKIYRVTKISNDSNIVDYIVTDDGIQLTSDDYTIGEEIQIEFTR